AGLPVQLTFHRIHDADFERSVGSEDQAAREGAHVSWHHRLRTERLHQLAAALQFSVHEDRKAVEPSFSVVWAVETNGERGAAAARDVDYPDAIFDGHPRLGHAELHADERIGRGD